MILIFEQEGLKEKGKIGPRCVQQNFMQNGILQMAADMCLPFKLQEMESQHIHSVIRLLTKVIKTPQAKLRPLQANSYLTD